MTAVSVPNTSNRGCPSILAGTTCPCDRSLISASAPRSTIRCRTDPSGRLPRCVTHPRHHRPSATIPAYDSLTRRTPTEQQLATGACSNFPTEPSPGLPIGDKRAFPLPTVSAPNSSQMYNSLQNRRERRLRRLPPVGRSRRDDRSLISLPPSKEVSALLAAMWLRCGCLADLHFCNSAEFRGTCPDQTLLAHLPTSLPSRPISAWKRPRLAFLQLTQIPVHPHDIKTGLRRRSRRLQKGYRPPQPAPTGSLVAMSPGPILAISPLTAGLRLRDDIE